MGAFQIHNLHTIQLLVGPFFWCHAFHSDRHNESKREEEEKKNNRQLLVNHIDYESICGNKTINCFSKIEHANW